ncbi:MAG: hypothetical protein Q8P25_04510 [Candidatus Curtissbacteria bacterium]|nr:hypothetical protein [Candidatus Curtissbacteria bacterium]
MKIKKLFNFKGKLKERLLKLNLLFVFVFLNIWDFVISREILNAMALGLIMFSPAMLLWLVGSLRAVVLMTVISLFELMVMIIFILEGLQLGGIDTTIKSIFWLPYLVMVATNGFWGLKIYSEAKEKKEKK